MSPYDDARSSAETGADDLPDTDDRAEQVDDLLEPVAMDDSGDDGLPAEMLTDRLLVRPRRDDSERALEGLESSDLIIISPEVSSAVREGVEPADQPRAADDATPVSIEDPVRMYLREIGRVPLLTAQLEIDLSMAMERGTYISELRQRLSAETGAEPDAADLVVAIYGAFRQSWHHVDAMASAAQEVAPAVERSERLVSVLPLTRFAEGTPRQVATSLDLSQESLEESLRLRQVEWDLLPKVVQDRLRLVDGDWPDDDEVRALAERQARQLQRSYEQRVADGVAAKVSLTEANLRLVVSVAKKYAGRGMSMLDLVQEGNLGLIRAVEKFQHHKGFRFSTYATWWIRQAISRAIADQARTIRIPVHMVETINRVIRTSRRLHQELGREPTSEEIGAALDMTPERVREVLKISQEPVSLGMPVGDEDDSSLGDFIEDHSAIAPPDAAANALLSEQMKHVLEELSDRERQVIVMRFGLDDGRAKTLEEVGREFNVTRERIRQIEAKALRKLRHPNRRQRLEDYLD